jgi:hypothetical protein
MLRCTAGSEGFPGTNEGQKVNGNCQDGLTAAPINQLFPNKSVGIHLFLSCRLGNVTWQQLDTITYSQQE